MQTDAPQDLILTNKERLAGEVKVKGTLGCSDHGGTTWTSGEQTLSSSGICLEIPQDKPLEAREVQESSLIRKDNFLKSSKLVHPEQKECQESRVHGQGAPCKTQT